MAVSAIVAGRRVPSQIRMSSSLHSNPAIEFPTVSQHLFNCQCYSFWTSMLRLLAFTLMRNGVSGVVAAVVSPCSRFI